MKTDVEQLVTLQRSIAPDTKTIYCFPGAGDSVTCFLSLADSLGVSFTVHGIQPRGLEGTSAPYSTVDEVVRDNIDAIRRTHPGGPYRLLGHSFGGWIAFEMALRLTADGEKVDTLVLLDTDPPTTKNRAKNQEANTITRIDALLELIRNLEDKAAQRLCLGRSELEGLSADAQLRALMNAMKTARLFPQAATLPSIARLVDVFEANLRTTYSPARPLEGDILLVHPAINGANGEGEDAARAWKAYASRIQRVVVPGTHMRMLVTPGVGGITEAVRRVWCDGLA